MINYDTAVILGSRPRDGKTWRFPSHVYYSLDRAVELYNKKKISFITVSGKWTLNFDVLHITQPFTECEKMADYLLAKGIPDNAILRESESKDTISNIYYLKRQIFESKGLRSLLFIAAEPRLPRIEFLCQRILGPTYSLHFEAVAYAQDEVSPNEQRTLTKQTAFLAPMKDGDDAWLDGKFYVGPYYDAVRNRVIERAAHEPLLYLANPPWSAAA
jgi:uncharacterized SAM-binding protein YcdF (DUF218 family)